jgi:CheY-like chemotaxis protein
MADERRRILVVEDDRATRELLSEVLLEEGYEVKVAAGGREALLVLGDWRPGLIVLDLVMGEMDGWAFRAAQRSLAGAAGVPVLVVSALDGARYSPGDWRPRRRS